MKIAFAEQTNARFFKSLLYFKRKCDFLVVARGKAC